MTINYPENKARHRPGRRPAPLSSVLLPQGRPDIALNRHDRAPTEQPEEYDSLEYKPCLEVRFNKGPKTSCGLIAGWDPNADVRLPKWPGVSFHHFALTFDDDYFPIIRDLGSSCGTSVRYGNEATGPRQHTDFVVGGHNFLKLKSKNPINIEIIQFLQFQLIVPHRDTTSPAYRKKVDIFLTGTTNADELLSGIKLASRAETQMPTGTHTPRTDAVVLKEKVGSGAFADVYHVWNVTTREEYAEKGLSKAGRKKLNDPKKTWEKEARVMSRISHKHIVKFLDVIYHPKPSLRLEYVPEGSLHDHLKNHTPFTGDEIKQILCQSLEALIYLHGLDPQIVHRDIKTENILVAYRRNQKILIKIADFGLAKEGEVLKTFCGTLQNLPPELCNIPQAGYTPACDMWSLGVVIVQLLCGLPDWIEDKYKDDHILWCRAICFRLKEWFKKTLDPVAELLLRSMAIMDADARWTALETHAKAGLLPDGPGIMCKTSHPIVEAAVEDDEQVGSEQTTIRVDVHDDGNDDDEEVQTMILRNTETAGRSALPGTKHLGLNPGDMNPSLPSLDSASLDGYLTGFSKERNDRLDASSAASVLHTTEFNDEVKLPVDEYLVQFNNPHGSLFYKSSFGQTSISLISSENVISTKSLDLKSSSVPAHQGDSERPDRALKTVTASQVDPVDVEWGEEENRLYAAFQSNREGNLKLPVSDDEWTNTIYMSRNLSTRKRARLPNDAHITSTKYLSQTQPQDTVRSQDRTVKRRNTRTDV